MVNSFDIKVLKANENLAEISAPIRANKNHLGTAFGGSTYSLAVLACYTWLFNMLDNKKVKCHVVIKSGQMKYLAPVETDFTALCVAPEDLNKFLTILERKKKSQITLKAEIKTSKGIAGLFEGEFVAVDSSK